MKRIRITTTLRRGIKDNQGLAVQRALQNYGFEIDKLTIGKVFDLTVDDSITDDQFKEIGKAIANPIMEDVKIEIL